MTHEQLSQLIDTLRLKMTDEDAENLIEQVTAVPEKAEEKKWMRNIIEAADIIKEHKGIEKAIKLLTEAYKEWPITYPSAYSQKADILKRTCMLQLEAKMPTDAHITMNRYIYNALKQVSAGNSIPKMRYYSFRSFSEHSLKDIKNEQISLAHPREFNDPLDTILVWWLDDKIKNERPGLDLDYKLLMKKVAEHIKIRCLVGSKYKGDGDEWYERNVEDLNVLMWAHYAKSHTGFCVEYEFDKTKLKMSYRPEEDKVVLIQPIHYVDSINLVGEPSMESALFQKSDFWSYENEVRLCSFDIANDEEFPAIDCKGAVKAIYLGAKCNDMDRRDMERAIGNKDIPLYKMIVDDEKLTRFKKTQIG